MLKRLGILLVLAVAALGGWLYLRGSKPPEVTFAKATRGAIESTVTTNGKVEPVEWAAARAEVSGIVESVPVARGQRVYGGQTLAVQEARQAKADLVSAEARIDQITSELRVLDAGGRSTDLAEIDSGIMKAQLDRSQAQRDVDSLTRLQAKNSATKFEVQEASDRVARAQAQIQSLTARRAALVGQTDLSSTQAKLREAQAAAALAKQKIALAVVKSPLEGVVYQLDVKPGAYLETGGSVAAVGRVERLRVVVYVDEPELGRVKKGMPVTISWDALPSRRWQGEVDRVPTQIVPLGTRQVGEVTCIIENPDGTLLPGTNVNASILSERAASAIRIPKESVVRQGERTGVWLLDSGRVQFRPIRLGVANITTVQVAEGLKEGEEVALPSPSPLSDGMAVTPSIRAGQ